MRKLTPLALLCDAQLLASCSDVASGCPPGLVLNAQGTNCECPAGQVMFQDECVDEGPCEGVSCDDDNPCTADGNCSPLTGECPAKVSEPDGTACSLEAGAGRCVAGSCEEIPDVCRGVVCDDENDCTKNVCQDSGGEAVCVYPNEDDTTECDADGNPGFCDGEGTCLGLCLGVSCDDSDECTVDGECNPATGACPEKTPVDCDDEDPCTADTCESEIGCVNAFIDNDGDGYAPLDCAVGSPHQGGDCHDGIAERNPGQTQFFSVQTCEFPETPPCVVAARPGTTTATG